MPNPTFPAWTAICLTEPCREAGAGSHARSPKQAGARRPNHAASRLGTPTSVPGACAAASRNLCPSEGSAGAGFRRRDAIRDGISWQGVIQDGINAQKTAPGSQRPLETNACRRIGACCGGEKSRAALNRFPAARSSGHCRKRQRDSRPDGIPKRSLAAQNERRFIARKDLSAAICGPLRFTGRRALRRRKRSAGLPLFSVGCLPPSTSLARSGHRTPSLPRAGWRLCPGLKRPPTLAAPDNAARALGAPGRAPLRPCLAETP